MKASHQGEFWSVQHCLLICLLQLVCGIFYNRLIIGQSFFFLFLCSLQLLWPKTKNSNCLALRVSINNPCPLGGHCALIWGNFCLSYTLVSLLYPTLAWLTHTQITIPTKTFSTIIFPIFFLYSMYFTLS